MADAFPNAVLINGYGLTEGGASVCALPPGEARRRPGSVGKPMPGAEGSPQAEPSTLTTEALASRTDRALALVESALAPAASGALRAVA